VRAKIVKNFARIHKANLVNFGILPLCFVDPADYESIEQGDMISIPRVKTAVSEGASEIPVLVNGRELMTRLEVSDRQRRILLAGGILNLAKKHK
jgi:aconitate hydratase